MTILTSDLDFENIKAKLKTHFKKGGTFADYDFEASGLSSIMDVLAYNTHINGLIANMATNESFLTTAQLRASVVQHAEALGYVPRSRTAAVATISVEINIPQGPSVLTIPQYTEFTTQIDDINYTFVTLESINVPAYNTFEFGNLYRFTTNVYEGTVKTKTFVADNSDHGQVYVIPDTSIDTTTMVVKVFEDFSTTSYKPYFGIDSVVTITPESAVFFLRESPNGYYEVFFSDGTVVGQAPQAGNKIVVEYVSTQGGPANGAKEFTSEPLRFDGTSYPMQVTLVAPSAGGSDKESMASIRSSAPSVFAAQKRLVTHGDYRAIILKNYSNVVDDVACWGGNDNVPPQYGKVYVSLKFKDGITPANKDLIKAEIKDNITDHMSIMSIDTVFVDPVTTYLELLTTFNVDPSKSGESVYSMQSKVEQVVTDYVQQSIGKFGVPFRRSNLTSKIDDLAEAILNTKIDVAVQQRIESSEVLVGTEKDYKLAFPFILASPDKDHHVITSSVFRWNGQNVRIKNELGSNKLQIFGLNDEVKSSNVGYYEPGTGIVLIHAVAIELAEQIKISALPANQSTLRPLRNYIMQIDSGNSLVRGNIENIETKVIL